MALAKHQTQLQELRLDECGVDDGMLDALMDVRYLRSLHVQDEDAPEESHPTNQGLARIANLTSLERLELFGEELRLDPELLASIARLPCLQHLAVAGLDALHALGPGAAFYENERGRGGGASGYPAERMTAGGGLGGAASDDEDMDLSSGGEVNDDDNDDDASSDSGMSMEDVTSRPNLANANASATSAHPQHPQRQECSPQPGPERCGGCQEAGDAFGVPPPHFSITQPLQALPSLTSLVLYGPASLRVFPPPLSLLLPQPRLRMLKLSACASAANLRALTHQRGLEKLTLSHSAVVDLYPATSASAMDVVEDSSTSAPRCPHHAQQGRHNAHHDAHPHDPHQQGAASAVSSPPASLQLPPPAPQQHSAAAAMSILGYGPEVAAGLAGLRVLRLKDLPGFSDVHLADLVAALAGLTGLRELKLRSLPGVSDVGLSTLPGLRGLARLKLYGLGYGVSEMTVACVAASMPGLQELKVKGCPGVGHHLAALVADARTQLMGGQGSAAAATAALMASAPGQPRLVVRCGVAECGGSAEAKGEGLGLVPQHGQMVQPHHHHHHHLHPQYHQQQQMMHHHQQQQQYVHLPNHSGYSRW